MTPSTKNNVSWPTTQRRCSTLSDRVHVKSAAEFDDPGREIVEVDDREVGVIKREGEYYALLNVCLHEGGPVAKGEVRPGWSPRTRPLASTSPRSSPATRVWLVRGTGTLMISQRATTSVMRPTAYPPSR